MGSSSNRSNLSRLGYLQAMGVDVYVRRYAVPEDVADDAADSQEQKSSSQQSVNQTAIPALKEATIQTSQDGAPLATESTGSDEVMVDVVINTARSSASQAQAAVGYVEMAGEPVELGALADISTSTDVQSNDVSELDWQPLVEHVSQCQACGLAAGRTQTVFGTGNRQADVLVIGEAPGQEEDRQGEPFVGRAGQLLDAMLLAIGMTRQQVYIANMLKCRPPSNRDPERIEVEACNAYLQRQIQLLQPKVLLVVGRIAAQALLDTEQTIGRLRGSVHALAESQIPVIVTYHPAYLLRQPSQKEKSWQDLQLLMRVLRGTA